jgi:dTDP-4-amino-4,6-dideoxygalactose transaminase
MTNIPLVDIAGQARALQAELAAAVSDVLTSGQYILGKGVAAFEEALAKRCGCQFGVGVNSGTDALELALRACGVGPGDEVLIPAFTFMATALAVTSVGATPVLADTDERSYGIDVEDAARRVTSRTKAIIPVHLYGQPCDVDGVLRLAASCKLHVIEDCAQAIGATYHGKPVGSFGAAGCFSFYPTKNLGAAGDGGAVVTNDAKIAEHIRLARNYGTQDKIHYPLFGRNTRLDELQAAILSVKLRHLDAWNEARRVRAGWYREVFAQEGAHGIGLPEELPNRRHVYHLFIVRVPERDRVHQELNRRGIHTMVHYPRPIHLDSLYAGRAKAGDFPRAERAAREVLSLPMYPELSREDIVMVVRTLKDVIHESQEQRLGSRGVGQRR